MYRKVGADLLSFLFLALGDASSTHVQPPDREIEDGRQVICAESIWTRAEI